MVMARRSAHLTTPFLGKLEEAVNQYFVLEAQWLSGRVFDSIPSGRGFEPNRPLAGYGFTSPPRGNFVDHIFLEAQCHARILQHVSPLTMAALSCNSLFHTLPYKIFDN